MNQHPAKYEVISRRYLSSINVNLSKTANITKQTKEEIPLFIQQNKRVNFAYLQTKFSLTNDSPEKWLELQHNLLHPSWLLNHSDSWLPNCLNESKHKIKYNM